MKNSTTIYQLPVAGSTQGVPKSVLVVHYMDDMLAHHSLPDLERVSSHLLLNLEKLNLNDAPKKIQGFSLMCLPGPFYL